MAGWVLNQSLLFLSSTMTVFLLVFFCFFCANAALETTREYFSTVSFAPISMQDDLARREHRHRRCRIVISNVHGKLNRRIVSRLLRLSRRNHIRNIHRYFWFVCDTAADCPAGRIMLENAKKNTDPKNLIFHFVFTSNHPPKYAIIDTNERQSTNHRPERMKKKMEFYRWFVLTALKTNKNKKPNNKRRQIVSDTFLVTLFSPFVAHIFSLWMINGPKEREREREADERCRKIYHRIIYMRNISHLWIIWSVSSSERQLRILSSFFFRCTWIFMIFVFFFCSIRVDQREKKNIYYNLLIFTTLTIDHWYGFLIILIAL